LKRLGAVGERRGEGEFRSRKTAAPLKLFPRFLLGGTLGKFRSRKTAAPLKLGAPSDQETAAKIIPQSKDCGPVEARKSFTARFLRVRIPQSKDCGPVEAALMLTLLLAGI